jgi:RNA polymerase sigma-70 factor (ECF subfamily)
MATAAMSDLIGKHLTQEFEELFRAHYQLVYRTAYGITGRTEDAEDVLQTVFLRLLRRGSPPDLQRNPKGYLYRAAVNLSLTTIQSRQRHVLTEDMESFESPANPAPTGPHEQLQRRLSVALAQLNPRAVEILILRYEHDYSDAEIARILGKSRGAIALTLFRARARLKALLCTSLSHGEKNHETAK